MEFKPGTESVWAGEEELFSEGATTPPIFQNVTYGYQDIDQWTEVATGKKKGHIYSRNTNPTVKPLEDKIARLEGAAAATAFATGMAAISNTFFALLKPGSRIISIKDTYGGTNRLFTDFLPKWGVEVVLCETEDETALLSEIEKGADMVYLETPTNPTLKILSLAKISKAARQKNAWVVVDNTFATPLNQNPLKWGADLVIHSATKFLGGHSDALGGLVCGSESLVKILFQFREIHGATMSPLSAYLILRGMKTLELRIERQNKNAMEIARFLSDHSKVQAVYYPGLETHPGHAIAKQQMSGFGGMLSFALKGDESTVKKFLTNLKLCHRAASLGSVSTLVGIPSTTSHVELNAEQRRRTGIPETLIRYSTGIENIEDLLQDLSQALQQIT